MVNLKQKVGSGFEHHCYIKHEDGAFQPVIVKVPHWLGRLWQTQGSEFTNRCLKALKEVGISVIDMEVLENIDVTYPNGRVKNIKTFFQIPYICDVHLNNLKYSDLICDKMHHF